MNSSRRARASLALLLTVGALAGAACTPGAGSTPAPAAPSTTPSTAPVAPSVGLPSTAPSASSDGKGTY